MRVSISIVFGTTFFCVLVGGAAFAQDYNEDDSGEEDRSAIETIVVTGTRTPRELAKVGSAVSIIDQEELSRNQDILVVDALERVPGITVRRSSNRPGSSTSIFIRGADSDQTLVLVDGVRVQDSSAPNRESFLDHLSIVDVERIEVIRGPQSVLYGSDAIGGVIHIITKTGSGPPSLHLRAQAGSFRTFDEAASVSGGGDSYHYRFSATRTDSRGFNIRGKSGDRDGYARTTVSSRLGLGTEALGVDSSVQYISADTEIDTGTDFSRSDTQSEQIIFQVAPHLSLFGGKWSQTLAYSLNTAKRDTGGSGFVLPSDFESTFQEADWQHTVRPTEWATTVLGFEYEREDARFKTPVATVDADVDQFAGYVDQHLSWDDWMDLTVGARVTKHDRFGTNFVGRAAIAVRSRFGTKLHASVANGFKAPTLAQLFDTTFAAANRDLDPEKSLGWDIGIEQRLIAGRVWFDVTWFENDLDDLILAIPPVFQNTNVEKVRTRGVEAALDLCLFENVPWLGDARSRWHYTWSDTKAIRSASFGVSDGQRLLRRPEHEFFAELIWSPYYRVETVLSLQYVGERFDIDANSFARFKAKSYLLVNLSGSFEITGSVTLFGRIENLADKQYEDVAGFNTAGLSGYGGIKADFY